MPKVPADVLPALTPAEVGKLLAACENERDRAALLFLLDSGLRAGEFVALNIGDVDTQTGAVTVHEGKGQKGRIAYIGVKARRALLRYLLTRDDVAPSAPLWVSVTTGERLTHWGLRLRLRHIGQQAGVICHPHKLRRTFAIWALRSGMDLVRLAQMLGHADLQTVRKYLAIVQDDLADAHRAHGPVDTLLRKGKDG
jgi:integrase/recombinase XerD